jgi:hypothetical protein
VTWIIRHFSQGAFLGMAEHPKTRAPMPLFRRADADRPAMEFADIAAAAAALEVFAPTADDQKVFDIVPL